MSEVSCRKPPAGWPERRAREGEEAGSIEVVKNNAGNIVCLLFVPSFEMLTFLIYLFVFIVVFICVCVFAFMDPGVAAK